MQLVTVKYLKGGGQEVVCPQKAMSSPAPL